MEMIWLFAYTSPLGDSVLLSNIIQEEEQQNKII